MIFPNQSPLSPTGSNFPKQREFSLNSHDFPNVVASVLKRPQLSQIVTVVTISSQTLPYFSSLCSIVEKERENPGSSSERVAAGSLPDPAPAPTLPIRYLPVTSLTLLQWEAGKGVETPGQAGNTARVSLFRNPFRLIPASFPEMHTGFMVCRR
jgi:hypothetical protein